MTTALEVELKQYAHNLVADHVKYEYDRQIGLWQQHINLMVDAQNEAINRHQKVLDEARKQVEKEREANFALAMLALSALAGPVLSWVAGKIQYKWYPKVASKSKDRLVFLAEQDSPWGKYYHMIDKDHDKVWAKVFGDLGKQAAGWGIDKALKVVTPQSGAAMNAIESAASSDRASFKSRLENAMLAEARLTSDAIMSVAMSINENSDYGADCLQRLKRGNARARDPKVPEKELEVLAKQMIRADINARRQEWADEWFYYGNDPGTTAGLAEGIEREMWGLWILNEQLKMVRHYYGSGDSPLVAGEYWRVEGATFGDGGVPEDVLKRLADFGVVVGRTRQQRREEALRWEQLNAPAPTESGMDALRAAREKAQRDWLESRNKVAPNVTVIDPDRERRRHKEAEQRIIKALQRDADLNSVHAPTEDRPVIDVGRAVDTQKEIDALEHWAQRHPVALGAGQLRHRKRALPSIENIYPS